MKQMLPCKTSSQSTSYNPLGIIRIVAVAYFMFFELGDRFQDLTYFRDIEPELMTQNLFFRSTNLAYPFDLESKIFLGKTWLGIYKAMFFGFGTLAIFGVFTRLSLLCFACLSLYLNAGLTATTAFNHESILTQHILFILSISPGAKSLSIDSLAKAFRNNWPSGTLKYSTLITLVKASLADSTFSQLKIFETWGCKLILCLFCVVYLSAGISKIHLSDGKWWDGETLGFYLGRDKVDNLWIADNQSSTPSEPGKPAIQIIDHTYGFQTTKIGHWFAQSKPLLVIMSTGSLIWEFLPFLLFMRPLYRNSYLILSILMHQGIGLTMNLSFPSYQIYLLILIDWPSIFRKVRSQTQA